MFWKQKSKDRWIALGDGSTSFFHRQVVSYKHKSEVLALKDDNGKWLLIRSCSKVWRSLILKIFILMIVLLAGFLLLVPFLDSIMLELLV